MGAGVKLQSVCVAGFGVFGFRVVALESDGDGQGRGLVEGELCDLGRLLFLRCGCGRSFLVGKLLRGLAGRGCRFGLNLGLLPWSK